MPLHAFRLPHLHYIFSTPQRNSRFLSIKKCDTLSQLSHLTHPTSDCSLFESTRLRHLERRLNCELYIRLRHVIFYILICFWITIRIFECSITPIFNVVIHYCIVLFGLEFISSNTIQSSIFSQRNNRSFLDIVD